MTNYANWYAYYHTRMQLMKTAASQAFAAIEKPADIAANTSRFRVGLMSINNNTGSDFVNLDEFKTAHKNDWYNKLFAARPNSGTPLRTALSTAGRLYAGKYNGSSLNGVSVTDPLQYSCQQNFTISLLTVSGTAVPATSSMAQRSSAIRTAAGPPPTTTAAPRSRSEGPATCRRAR